MTGKRKRDESPEVVNTPSQDTQLPDQQDSTVSLVVREPSPSTVSLPLTRANLKQLERLNMAPETRSSKGKEKVPKTPTSTSQNNVPKTPATTVKSTSTGGLQEIITALRMNHIMKITNLDQRTEDFEKFIKETKEMVSGQRDSVMRPESASTIIETVDIYATKSETTFMIGVWHHIFKHTVRKVKRSENSDGSWVERKWLKDYIIQINDSEFLPGSIPFLEGGTEFDMEQIELSCPKIKNPKPDLVLGFDLTAFTPEEVRVMDAWKELSYVAREVCYGFCLVELKGHGGDPEVAVLQLLRGSSALIHALELLYDKSADPKSASSVSPIERARRSMVFGLAMTPKSVELYLHWASGTGGAREYLTHRLTAYTLQNEDLIKKLRHDLHNILDWGVLVRRPELTKLHGRVRLATPIPSPMKSSVAKTPSKNSSSTRGSPQKKK